MIDPSLQRAAAAAESVEALPTVVPRAITAIYSSRSSAREVGEIIGPDPALAGRILRLVNSAYHRTTSRPVVNLSEAVLRLGYQSVQSALLTAATVNLLNPPLTRYGLQRREFWHHSVATAISARAVAKLIRYPSTEESYITGLLHDVGKVGLDRHQAIAMTEVRGIVHGQAVSYQEAERANLGFDHADVGQLVVAKWGLPERTAAAIGQHHNAAETDPLAAIVAVGDAMAWAMGFVGAGDEAPNSFDSTSLGRLDLSQDAVERLIRETLSLVQESLGVLLPEAQADAARR